MNLEPFVVNLSEDFLQQTQDERQDKFKPKGG
jgi:hypothetical protein